MKKSSDSKSSSDNSSTKYISQYKTSRSKNIEKKMKDKVQDGDTVRSKRTTIYRGVSKHKLTGRFEAHLWDKESLNNQQTKKGRQVYLGAYENEESAAHAYDLAALKYWGLTTTLNFPVIFYGKEIEEMQNFTKEEYIATLKRKSIGFSRGVSKYKGVVKHHSGRWEARIGRMNNGKRYTYLGTYESQEDAAMEYDKAIIQHKGVNAVTNFDLQRYKDLFKQDHPQEHDIPLQTNDKKQKDEQENYNPDEKGKQDNEMNVLPPTVGCFNDMDFENMLRYGVEQPRSSCMNDDEAFKINLFDEGPREKPGELEPFFNNGFYEKPDELTPSFSDIQNNLENHIDTGYDDLWTLDDNYLDINMSLNEPSYGNFGLDQFGTVTDNSMQTEAINQYFSFPQDMSSSTKENCTDDEARKFEKKKK